MQNLAYLGEKSRNRIIVGDLLGSLGESLRGRFFFFFFFNFTKVSFVYLLTFLLFVCFLHFSPLLTEFFSFLFFFVSSERWSLVQGI